MLTFAVQHKPHRLFADLGRIFALSSRDFLVPFFGRSPEIPGRFSRVYAANAAENLVVVRHIALNLLRSMKGVDGGIASRRMQSAYDDTVREKVLSAGLN